MANGSGNDVPWVPRPDPTLLTTVQLDRAISNLEKLFTMRFEALERERHLILEDFERRMKQLQPSEVILARVDTVKADLLRIDEASLARFRQIETQTTERFSSQEKALHLAWASSKEAMDKAETANDKRFESVNEFREQLADQTRTLLPRREYEALHNQLVSQVASINTNVDRLLGQKQGNNQIWGMLVGGAGVLIALVTVIMTVIQHGAAGGAH